MSPGGGGHARMMGSAEANEGLERDHHGLVCAPSD